MQAYDSIICGYICMRRFGFMSGNKILKSFTNLSSPYKSEENNLYSYFLMSPAPANIKE